MTITLTRWDPFREAVTLREAMDRLFEDSWAPAHPRMDQGSRSFQLPLDAYVTLEEIVIIANMPGVKPEAVEITLEGDRLSIKAERSAPIENVEYVMQERPFGVFARTLNLNVPVDSDRAEANFENGLLTLVIPKAESVKLRTIPVTSR